MRTLFLLIIVSFALMSCNVGSLFPLNSTSSTKITEVSKIKVDLDGNIFLNGKRATIDEVKQEFARLKAINGGVWYFRENSKQDPPPKQWESVEQILKAIDEARLPFRLVSSEEEFNKEAK